MELILILMKKPICKPLLIEKNNNTTVHRDNDDSNLIKRQSANSLAVKKEVFVIGDSMIKYVNGREVSRNNSVKVRTHPAATTDDFIDYVRPTVRKKPNLIIIHTRTNDIQNNVNTLHKTWNYNMIYNTKYIRKIL